MAAFHNGKRYLNMKNNQSFIFLNIKLFLIKQGEDISSPCVSQSEHCYGNVEIYQQCDRVNDSCYQGACHKSRVKL